MINIKEILDQEGIDSDKFLDIRYKASIIASKLGDRLNYFNIGKTGYSYNKSKLSIKIVPINKNELFASKVIIGYNCDTVFNDENLVFVKGKWSEIIDFMYDHLDDMIQEENRKYLTLKNMHSLLSDDDITINIDNIKITCWTNYTEYEPDWSNCTYYRKNRGIDVSKNGDVVLSCCLKSDYDTITNIMKYTPGKWENVIDLYIQQLNKEKAEKFDQENGKDIDKELSLLKKRYE